MTNGTFPYQDFVASVGSNSFEAAKRTNRLPQFASYLVSVMRLFENKYFDENGNKRQTPDSSVMYGYDDQGLYNLLRVNLRMSLELLTHESTPKGFPLSPTLSGENVEELRIIGEQNYTVTRIPQSVALMYNVDKGELAILKISPAIRQQVAIDIKETKLQNTGGPNIVDSLNALAFELGQNELSRVLGRTVQGTQYRFVKIEKI